MLGGPQRSTRGLGASPRGDEASGEPAPPEPLAASTAQVSSGDPLTEAGFTVASAIWVMAVTLILVTAFANLFVQRYAQAVIRQATDEGARAWAVNGGTADDCMLAAADVMGDLLGGPLASGVSISCVDTGTEVTVTATATLAGLPPLPDANFTTASVVTKELEDGLELP